MKKGKKRKQRPRRKTRKEKPTNSQLGVRWFLHNVFLFVLLSTNHVGFTRREVNLVASSRLRRVYLQAFGIPLLCAAYYYRVLEDVLSFLWRRCEQTEKKRRRRGPILLVVL